MQNLSNKISLKTNNIWGNSNVNFDFKLKIWDLIDKDITGNVKDITGNVSNNIRFSVNHFIWKI